MRRITILLLISTFTGFNNLLVGSPTILQYNELPPDMIYEIIGHSFTYKDIIEKFNTHPYDIKSIEKKLYKRMLHLHNLKCINKAWFKKCLMFIESLKKYLPKLFHKKEKMFTSPQSISLLHAASTGCYYLVSFLIGAQADINVQDNCGKATPLYYSLLNSHRDITDLLLRLNCKIYGGKYYGRTYLELAAETGNNQALSILLKQHAFSDDEKKNALHLAINKKHYQLIDTFKSVGTYPEERFFKEQFKPLWTL